MRSAPSLFRFSGILARTHFLGSITWLLNAGEWISPAELPSEQARSISADLPMKPAMELLPGPSLDEKSLWR
jgi:hypothetical protein